MRDLFFFLCAVLCGTTAGVLSQEVFRQVVTGSTAANMSLALAATVSGAAHGRLVHGHPMSRLLPGILAGAPLAYGAMRTIHLIIGF